MPISPEAFVSALSQSNHEYNISYAEVQIKSFLTFVTSTSNKSCIAFKEAEHTTSSI